MPTGLYHFVTGPAARGGFAEYQTDQDWDNDMLLWPTELVPPGDRLVAGTLKRLHDTKFREGIMTYRNGMHLHQYITMRAIDQFTANGQPQAALVDMYHALLHAGSGYESFENMIRPWTDRDVEFCPPPHAWGCANSSNTIRNLFVMEQGGRGGLEPEKRDILLLNAVSPAWLVDSRPLGIERAPTSFGLVSVNADPAARRRGRCPGDQVPYPAAQPGDPHPVLRKAGIIHDRRPAVAARRRRDPAQSGRHAAFAGMDARRRRR